MARYKDLFRYLKRDCATLFYDSHYYHTSHDLARYIVKDLPTDGNILVLYNVELVIALIEMRGVDPKQITFFTDHDNKNILMDLYGVDVTYNLSGVYDLIVSNPPFTDEDMAGGQNKIYNQLSKKCLSMLTPTGAISFTTPVSVLKKNKRFSLVGQVGLKEVDFTVEKYFNKRVCHWVVDKTYTGDVSVTDRNGVFTESKDDVIFDTSRVDKEFGKIYHKLKALTANPKDRMFRQNNHGPALNKSKTDVHVYPLYKLDKGKVINTYWTKRIPHGVGETKLSLPMTKMMKEEYFLVDTKDFDPGYMCHTVKDETELENIKSFLLSDYFKQHVNKWKQVDGYGYNYAIKYLPQFDTSKKWKNEEVKQFIESKVVDKEVS